METNAQLRFEYLHKELVEYQTRFIDMIFKGAGLSLLILGWMLTSDSARSFIASSTKARAAAIAGIAIIEVAYVVTVARMTTVINHLGRELGSLEYFPPSYYDYRVFPRRIIIAAAGVATAPGFVTIALMLFHVP